MNGCTFRCEEQIVDIDKEIQRKIVDITNCNKQISSAEEDMVRFL